MSAQRSRRVKEGLDPDTGIKDFSEDPSEPIEFYAGLNPDRELYHAVADVPGGMFLDLADIASSENTAETVRAVKEFFTDVLTEECAVDFLERLDDAKRPIPLKQALKIFEWLIGIYSGETERP